MDIIKSILTQLWTHNKCFKAKPSDKYMVPRRVPVCESLIILHKEELHDIGHIVL